MRGGGNYFNITRNNVMITESDWRQAKAQLVQFYHDMVSNLDGALNRGHKQTDVIIMDFTKAFDKVPHRRL